MTSITVLNSQKDMVFYMDAKFEKIYLNVDKVNNHLLVSHKERQTTSAEKVINIFKDIVSVQKHNISYDQLLQVYTNHISQVLSLKLDMKKDFYDFCKGILIFVTLGFLSICAILFTCYLHGVIPSDDKFKIFFSSTFATFFTSFISIPIIIAKYLFSPEEEKSATEIVKNMQLHDKATRKLLLKNNNKK